MRKSFGKSCLIVRFGLAFLLLVAVNMTHSADLVISNEKVQQQANAVLALLGYSVVPDITASSLSIDNSRTGNPDIRLSQLAGGFTVSDEVPLYLEGGIGLSRYDPVFVASDGTDEREIPLKWNGVALTGGVGWDFPITSELDFRPIANVSLGHVESDTSIIGRVIEEETGLPVSDFLDGGRLNAYGYGGSVMLDWERYLEDHEIDVELRYTWIRLESFDSSSSVAGSADVPTCNVWTRYRAPTGATFLQRPLRYVLEYAFSSFEGDQAGVLGFDYLNSIRFRLRD